MRTSPASLAQGISGAAGILRHVASDRQVGLVVLFHRVGYQPGDPRRELVPAVGVAQFRTQLRWMRRLFRPVPAADILAAANRRRRWGRIPIAITFDDEWSTHVPLALPALRAERIRATFFLTGAQLEGPAPFWWELLQEASDRGLKTDEILPGSDIFEQAAVATAAPASMREDLASALAGLGAAPVAATMPPDDIRRLAAEHDIGFHTRRHDALDRLNTAQLHAALRDGRDALERVVGQPLTMLAYPHGAAGSREATAAGEAGFSFGFTTNWHPCGPETEPLLIGRIEPGAVSAGAFLRALAETL
jgi:peptidoglycan/xylan/chitin deacetylase (PgdA/CDA1 family)